MYDILQLIAGHRVEDFEAGSIVIEQGSKSGPLLVLIKGEVEVLRDNVRVAKISEPGAIFGEMSVLLDSERTATVRALQASTFAVIENPRQFLASSTEAGLHVAVLLASRLDALEDLEQREPVDVLGLAAEEAARVDATLEPSQDAQALTVTGDERLLRRALRNLLENAKRYGGNDVSVNARRTAGKVELLVCDRGPGVPPSLRERIFEPFYRLPGHAEKSGGVGLGLSLVKQIAERHGGSVRCEPRDGGGSCFVLALGSR